MKYIQKKPTNEPCALKTYKQTTPKPISYNGYIDRDIETGEENVLKKALLKEQGHICAYCMKRISLKRSSLSRDEKTRKAMVEVEHYLSQGEFPEKDLDYGNMLGVCNGYFRGDIHCDKCKLENRLKILNPLDKKVESWLTYSLDGSILAFKNADEVSHDLNEVLNLNCENMRLARQEAIDLARNMLKEKYPIRQWTKTIIQKEIKEWSSMDIGGKYRPFCQIVVWFWEQEKKKNRYPAK
jgi:uncharacterized protein (TIGR02646 family)